MKLRELFKKEEKPRQCQFCTTPGKILYIKEVERETKHLIRRVRKAEKKNLETQKREFKNLVDGRNRLYEELKEIENEVRELDRLMNDRVTKQQMLQHIQEVEQKTGYKFTRN